MGKALWSMRYVNDISILKEKESVFVPFQEGAKMQAVHLKPLPPVTSRSLSLRPSTAPEGVTSAVMTRLCLIRNLPPSPTFSRCPWSQILEGTPLLPPLCSFRPPLREAGEGGHTLCTKPSQSLHCSSGESPHPTSARAPAQLAALAFSLL